MKAEKIPRALSDAYMEGWGASHKGNLRITARTGKLYIAWMRGFDDSEKGTIDARWALGPDLLVTNQKRKNEHSDSSKR